MWPKQKVFMCVFMCMSMSQVVRFYIWTGRHKLWKSSPNGECTCYQRPYVIHHSTFHILHSTKLHYPGSTFSSASQTSVVCTSWDKSKIWLADACSYTIWTKSIGICMFFRVWDSPCWCNHQESQYFYYGIRVLASTERLNRSNWDGWEKCQLFQKSHACTFTKKRFASYMFISTNMV